MTKYDAMAGENGRGLGEPIGFAMASADDVRGRRARDARRPGSNFAPLPASLAPADVRGAADEYEPDPEADPRAME